MLSKLASLSLRISARVRLRTTSPTFRDDRLTVIDENGSGVGSFEDKAEGARSGTTMEMTPDRAPYFLSRSSSLALGCVGAPLVEISLISMSWKQAHLYQVEYILEVIQVQMKFRFLIPHLLYAFQSDEAIQYGGLAMQRRYRIMSLQMRR